MRQQTVEIYRADSIDDAQRVADQLRHAGIEAYVDVADKIMKGVLLGPRSRIVRVREVAAARAREVIEARGLDEGGPEG